MTSLRTYIDLRTLELKQAFSTARGVWTQREVCVVCVEWGSVRGFGEAAPLPGFSRETFAQSVRDVRAMCGALQGSSMPEDLDALERVMTRIGEGLTPSARFAVEGALLDVLARVHALSVSQLLSPSASRRVRVNATLGARPAPESFAQAMSLKDDEHTCFKLKVGVRPLDEEMASVRAVREAIGDAATLRLDANGAWSVPRAIEAIEAMSKYGIALVEQPVDAGDIEGLAHVRRAANARGVAIAADEAVESEAALEAILAQQAADVIVIKPMMLGGVLPARRMMARAHARGVASIVTTLLEGVVGRTLTAHLVAASTDCIHAHCGLATGDMILDDLAAEPYALHGEWLELSDAPGLGLDVVLSAKAEGAGADAPPSRQHDMAQERLPLLRRRARTHGSVTAVITEAGERWGYGALCERVARLVTWLAHRGVKRGDRLALCAPNSAALMSVIHAAMAMGVCVVPMHPGWTERELERALVRVKPALAIGDVARTPLMVMLEQVITQAGSLKPALPEEMQGYAMRDRAVILFTSGTTGEPKMASLTWSNVYHSAMGSAIRLGHLPGDCWGLSLPLCHIGGLSIVVRCALLGTSALMFERFDAARVADAMVQGEMTMWSGVSAMMWQVLESLGDRRPMPGFRFALLGGGPVPPRLCEQSERHGIPVATTYGMTETGSQLTTRSPGMPGIDAESAGPALWCCEVRIAGDAREGEIQARGETLCEGYLNERLEVCDVRDAEGWFSTGDWGRIDAQGAVHVLERRTDLIVTGGENVYPAEIERVLAEHDGVRDVCVIGLPDERWGQRVVAVWVPTREDVDVASILAMSRTHLASFKVPRQMECWEELPRTSLGKLRRAEVRRRLEQHCAES